MRSNRGTIRSNEDAEGAGALSGDDPGKAEETRRFRHQIRVIAIVAMPLALVLLGVGVGLDVIRGKTVSPGHIVMIVAGLVFIAFIALELLRERRDRPS
jgi:hypothetical protein